jgi:hypothetical protein
VARNLKIKKSVIVVCFAAVLLVSLFGVRELLSVTQPVGEEYKMLAEELMSKARQEFEKIRGVSVREVSLEVVNQSWVADTWGTVSDSEREEITREENIYKALFLITPDVSLLETRMEWTTSFRAAKWQGKIYVVQENFDVTETTRATGSFVHELTHIMQEDYSISAGTTFDGAKALSSLKEGDATLMADTLKNDGIVPVSSSESSVDNTDFSLALATLLEGDFELALPGTIDDLNRFPYRYGLEFVKFLYEQGGWGAIDDAYSNPPYTSEQIMHPEKYFSQEGTKIVDAPQVNGNWTLVETNRFGEYFVFVMLEDWISEGDASEAAKGWGGDVFSYYELDDEFFFTWNIVWDTVDDAHEFYLAFQDMMYKTSAEKHNCSYWEANGRFISIDWNGDQTLIVSSSDEALIQQDFA